MPRDRNTGELIAGFLQYIQAYRRCERGKYQYARNSLGNLMRPQEALQSEQLKAISNLVDYAYSKSQYYRKKLDGVGFKPGEIRSLSDISRIPRLSKRALVEYMDDILCNTKSEMYSAYTSGTTGITMKFYRTHFSQTYRRGIDLAIPRYYGWRDGQWQAWLWSAGQDVLSGKGWRARAVKKLVERKCFINESCLSNEDYQQFVDDISKYRPTYVSAYPTLAYDLAERMEAGEVKPIRVPVISTTAEPLLDYQRVKIQSVLADEVYERYGAREYGIVGMECNEHKGMHTFMDSVYLESVPLDNAKDDQRVLLVTDLLNYGMPLIRYESGDYGDIDNASCPCGITTPRIYNIRGRVLDTIWRADGKKIYGGYVCTLIENLRISTSVQIIQEALDRIVIRIQARPGEYGEELQTLSKIIAENIDSKMKHDIQYVDKIERSPSGKFRNVINNIESTRKE